MPVTNSTAVMIRADRNIRLKKDVFSPRKSLRSPMNTKQSPPATNMEICENPRVMISIPPYAKPPVRNRNISLMNGFMLFLLIRTPAFLNGLLYGLVYGFRTGSYWQLKTLPDRIKIISCNELTDSVIFRIMVMSSAKNNNNMKERWVIQG